MLDDCRKCEFYQLIVNERRFSGTVLKTRADYLVISTFSIPARLLLITNNKMENNVK